MDDNRIFKAKDRFGAETEFYLKVPALIEETEAEMQYRIAYSYALKNNILPREKMKELMKSYGIWDEDNEKELQETIKNIAMNELELRSESTKGNKEICIKIANELYQQRIRMWQLFTIQQSAYVNSCEGYAETIRHESLMAACTMVKANNKRYWKDYKEYVSERDENIISDVILKVMNVQSNILNQSRDELLKALPENQWIEMAKSDFLEKEVEKAKEELKKKLDNVESNLVSEPDKTSIDN